MKAVGLITEYNPFHNGHLHHLQESKKLAEADVAVAVMSGHFLQRGEPALLDKWQRAKMALAAGVDLVVELPLPWACSSAPDFARGGVQALAGIGGIDCLCFGSESGKLEDLKQWSAVELQHQDNIQKQTSGLLRQGVAYPAARARVLKRMVDFEENFLDQPNNILGIEYMKAIAQQRASLEPLTIKRIGAGYHEIETIAGVSSATGIRQRLANGEAIAGLIPQSAATLLEQAIQVGEIYSVEQHFRILLAQIFSAGCEIEDFWLVEQGIGTRILEAADRSTTLDNLISAVKSRHLTRTRVQRLLLSILLGLKKETAKELLGAKPAYLHLLAVSPAGERFLAATRKQRDIPLIQNFSRIYSSLKRFYGAESLEYDRALKQLDLELKATRIYGLLTKSQLSGSRNRDFYQAVVRPE